MSSPPVGLCLIAALGASLPVGAAGAGPGAPAGAPALAVTLSLGAARLAPGEEVVATVELRNQGDAPFAVLEPGAYLPGLVVLAPDGKPVEPGPGLRVLHLKPGSYLGRAVLLRPGERRAFTFGIYLDQGRRVLCSRSREEGRIAPEIAASQGLPAGFPARYFAPGPTFRPGVAGVHRLVYRVQQAETDRSWRPSEDGPKGWATALWVGTAESAPVELSVP